jgi:TonB family protein
VIGKDGKFAGMKVVEPSGNATLEQWAQTAITQSAPFDPLPQQFAADSLELRYHFRFRALLAHPMSIQPGGDGQFGSGGGIHALSANAPPAGAAIEGKTYKGQPVYKPGGGVTAPEAIYQPDPEYTESARKKKLQGTVVLDMVVTPEGNIDDVEVVHHLDPGLDQKAVDAVRRWKFHPGTKGGTPVAVQINVETDFHLR